jgi:sugar lactone lactonase YvrE
MTSSPDIVAELVLDARASLGEGPLWSERERALWWVDILAKQLHRFDPASRQDRTVALPGMPGMVAERRRGGLVMAWSEGFAGLDPVSGAIERWCHPERALPKNRFNDGKCDPQGRLWSGAESGTKPADGGFWRLDADHQATRHLSGIGCSNGLAWSADARTLYYIDTPTCRVDAIAFDAGRGELGDRRLAFPIPAEHGWPDGMCIDDECMLWVAHWGGWAVRRYDPRDGRVLATIRVPAEKVTSCTFGGPDRRDLYITTARTQLDDAQAAAQPLAGGLFVARPGPSGPPAALYAG